MTSSTSSSEPSSPDEGGHVQPPGRAVGLWLPPGPDEGWRGLVSDSSLVALLAFVVLAIAIAAWRTDVRFAGSPKWFWMEKLAWGPIHDAVVAGDSRVYRGIDPSEITAGLGLARGCVNFGFSSATLTPGFLDAAVATLDPRGPRILFVAVTPAALRAPVRGRDGYLAARAELSQLRLPLRASRLVEEWEVHLTPFAIDRGFGEEVAASRATADGYSQIFHADGWVESDRQVVDPIATGIAVVRRDFERSPYSPRVEDELVQGVARLTAAGVRVIAFRPWVPHEVEAAEDEAAGIDFRRVRSRLESAGAFWVDPVPPSLRSYDGTHIDGPSARSASRALAIAAVRAVPELTSGSRPGN